MRFSRKITAILLSTFTWFPSFAQDFRPWTLEQCLEYAFKNNISIKRGELDCNEKEISVDESRWSYVPSIYASSSATLSAGRVLDETTYEFIQNSAVGSSSSSISSSLDIFSGFRKALVLKKSKVSLSLSEFDLLSLKLGVKMEVTAAFLNLLCSESNLETALCTRNLMESQVKRIADLVEVGRVTESDLLQAKAQQYATENDVASAEAVLETAKLELCQLLEIKDYESFSVFGDDILPILPSGQSAEEAICSRPEYRSAQLGVELAEKDVSIARTFLLPSVSLNAGYGSSFSDARKIILQNPDGTFKYETYPFMQQYGDNASSYISLGLSIPIFNGMLSRNSVRKAKLAVQDAKYELVETENFLIKEYKQAEIDCNVAHKHYLSARERVHYTEEAEQQMRERYDLGAVDFNSWNIAAAELAKSRYNLSEAKYTYIFKVKILEMLRSE